MVGETDTLTGDGTAMAARQPLDPAVVGADDVAPVALTVITVVSCSPASSFTVSVTVKDEPALAGVTVVVAPFELETACAAGSLLTH